MDGRWPGLGPMAADASSMRPWATRKRCGALPGSSRCCATRRYGCCEGLLEKRASEGAMHAIEVLYGRDGRGRGGVGVELLGAARRRARFRASVRRAHYRLAALAARFARQRGMGAELSRPARAHGDRVP